MKTKAALDNSAERLTAWQRGRRRRRVLVDRLMGTLFGLLALACIAYIVSLWVMTRSAFR